MSDIILESNIPTNFNEIDPNDDSKSILRTISDFSLFDSKGKRMPFEDLNERNLGILCGNIIEPYPEDWRNEMMKLACTSRQPPPKSIDEFIQPNENRKIADISQSNPIDSEPGSLAPKLDSFNRKELKTGDDIDGYCNKTFHWFEAKIIGECIDEHGDRLKIHFKGWNPKFDEWLPRDSDRIAAPGSSGFLMFEAAKKASDMVPWYEGEELVMKVANRLANGELITRKSISVRIECIEDWCIDYTYANPTLWLIGRSGVWYRIAGLFCPGYSFGQPSPAYLTIFSSISKIFLCAAHVSMVLLDFLPSMLKISLREVAEEVAARTKGLIDERFILLNFQLLVNQICGLEPPADWDKRISISKSFFISQLKKFGDIYVSTGGQYGLSCMYIPEPERAVSKKRKSLEEDDFENLPTSIQELPGWRALFEGSEAFNYLMPEEDRKSRAFEKIYTCSFPVPYCDLEYWNMQYLTANIHPVHPKPTSGSQFLCPPECIGQLCQIWLVTSNFRQLLGIPFISLKLFDQLMFQNSMFGSHTLYKSILVSILGFILQEETNFDIRACGKFSSFDSDGILSEGDPCNHAFVASSVINGLLSKNSVDGLKRLLWTGDACCEVLRTLIASKFDVQLFEYFDPLEVCEELLLSLLADPLSKSFSIPVDPDRDGAPDYFLVIREPMDLGTILKRVRSSWYDEVSVQISSSQISQVSNTLEQSLHYSTPKKSYVDDAFVENSIETNKAKTPKFLAGDRIDVFHDGTQRWYESEILSVNPSMNSVCVHYLGWLSEFDEILPSDSIKLAPFGVFSRDETKRSVHPSRGHEADIWNSPGAKMSINPEGTPVSRSTLKQMSTKLDESSNLSTQHRGYKGFVEDIEKVWKNCYTYLQKQESNHDLLEAAKTLEEKWNQLFKINVLDEIQKRTERDLNRSSCQSPYSQIKNSKGKGSKTTTIRNQDALSLFPSITETEELLLDCPGQLPEFKFSQIIESLQFQELFNLETSEQIEILSWLIQEFLSTQKVRNYLESLTQYMKSLLKKTEIVGDQMELEEIDNEENLKKKSKKSRKSFSESESVDPVKQRDSINGINNFEFSASMFTPTLRFLPLGEDRDGRLYFVFNVHDNTMKIDESKIERGFGTKLNEICIYCQDSSVKSWYKYESEKDINGLYFWLNDKTIKEMSLKKQS